MVEFAPTLLSSGNLPLRDSSGLRILFLVKIPTLSGGSIRASGPCSPGFGSQPSQNISKEKSIDIAEVKQCRWLEYSGLCLENVDRTHLVLASGKPVQQKIPNPCLNVQLKPLGWHDDLTIIQIT